jgi:hypothetical protein
MMISERMWEREALAKFEDSPGDLPGETEANHAGLRIYCLRPVFEPRVFGM